MAKCPFAVGDVVILNSGGPKMTVAEVQPGQVRVVWVDDDDDLEAAWFPNACVYQVGCDADCGVA
jgi:uncharacterized protein YodC (DUF2158 family)